MLLSSRVPFLGRLRYPEQLFCPPRTAGAGHESIQTVVRDSIIRCDVDVRLSLWKNVVIAGGTTLLKGFDRRLEAELMVLSPPGSKLKVIGSPHSTERRFSAWLGGSILASLGTFHQRWISRKEYEETGKTVVEKCP